MTFANALTEGAIPTWCEEKTWSSINYVVCLNLVDWATFAPHVRYRESVRRGYVILDVTPERLVAAWYHFERTDIDAGTSSFSAAFAAYDGQPHLVEEPDAAQPR